ncbi:Inherit from NOG: Metaxin 2 [Seminavis robusta]|uniref:Inherit from NOG: Metaxin 2 n=1 Tax=Seminavis robusta TaxID=568900 RepID=A0A9N8HHN6_9STRA|nr:Inherit from NOG: Metaxin 2 [Seminavis robusta]|eukprot:Sro649_g181190.1 Inherit from NOG: Metaxin 2 (488) ;mRNA; r:23599-25170
MTREGFLLFQAAIATSICNLTSDSRDRFATEKRTEGWTEVWGDGTAGAGAEDCWDEEVDAVARLSPRTNSMFPEISLTLVQYRPAWVEQLVLRMAGIPHVVVNSSYASYESTGPLPALQDYSDIKAPVLLGRRQPGWFNSEEVGGGGQRPENVILEYLKTTRGVDLDTHLVDPGNDALTKQRQTTSTLLRLLLTTKLQKSLTVLRYQDGDSWSQVYRKQCFDASRNHGTQDNPTSSIIPTARGVYQAWSERVMAQKTLMGCLDGASVEKAKQEARDAYGILEQQLSRREDSSQYILGTQQPALIDALVWAHLAEALCDVNLVVILADFPVLIQYFQFVHKTYFAVSSSDDTNSWQVWNKHQNGINCFQQVPLDSDDDKQQPEDVKNLKNALELMQTLSAKDHDLLNVLQKGKEARAQELMANQRKVEHKNQSESTHAEDAESKVKPELTATQKARLQQQRSDQYWLSIVALAAIAGGLSMLAGAESE